jgi:hypothetical protein
MIEDVTVRNVSRSTQPAARGPDLLEVSKVFRRFDLG